MKITAPHTALQRLLKTSLLCLLALTACQRKAPNNNQERNQP